MAIFDNLLNREFSRRDFLKGTVAATAAVAATGLGAFSSEVAMADAEATTAPAEHAVIVNPEEGGTWVAAACWHNCAGRCCNKVMVKDGVVIRQKTDDNHADSWDHMQQRACVRGRAQQQQCFGADRLKYPMKRKHWQPGGGENTHGELRGIDEWERISWDEAFKYVAEETKRIYEENNNEPVCLCRTGDCAKHIMALMGRLSQNLCKPPMWCRIGAPHRRYCYEQQKESQPGGAGSESKNPGTPASEQH